jgi:hypothetical protein
MEKNTNASGDYVRHPFVSVLYGVPNVQVREEIVKTARTQTGRVGRYLIGGVSTLVTNVNAALASTEAKLAECRRAVAKRNFSPVVELLRAEPWFCEHPWVKEILRRFGDHPRFKRKRGKFYRHKLDPLALMGLVNALRESGKARSRAQAYARLEGWGLVSERQAKRLYKKARSDPSCRAYAIVFPKERRFTEDEVNAIRAGYPFLQPGQTVVSKVEVPGLGPVDVQFIAHDAGEPTKDFVIFSSITINFPNRRARESGSGSSSDNS